MWSTSGSTTFGQVVGQLTTRVGLERATRAVVASTRSAGTGVATERDERPWGYYEVVDRGPGFQVKRISVDPGKRLSYQRHQQRREHWYGVGGVGTVTLDDVESAVKAGDAIDVPVGAAHRIQNTGDEDLLFIEVQTGQYFGEDDIERLDDDYGRRGDT